MTKSELSPQIKSYLDAVFFAGNGINWVTILGFIGRHTPLGHRATDRSIQDHLMEIRNDNMKDYAVRMIATYLIQGACNEPIAFPDKD